VSDSFLLQYGLCHLGLFCSPMLLPSMKVCKPVVDPHLTFQTGSSGRSLVFELTSISPHMRDCYAVGIPPHNDIADYLLPFAASNRDSFLLPPCHILRDPLPGRKSNKDENCREEGLEL
jgi:hypothetical protein